MTGPVRQRGVTLIIVLIVIGVILVANVALVSSLTVSTRVVSNKAFKQAATQAAEVALAAGENFVQSISTRDTATTNRYWPTIQPVDSFDLPTTVDWANVPVSQVGSFQVRWVVERMCNVTPVTDAVTQCLGFQQSMQSSQRAGSPNYVGQVVVYYRITAQVIGPRNTESYIQSAVAR
jgi:type IV pilus assembly protein PilX